MSVTKMEASKKRRLQWVTGVVGLGVLSIGFLAVRHKYIEVRFKAGDLLQIKSASIFESISRGKCEIDIRTALKQEAHIALYQDMFNSPVLVIPAKEAGIFICVYDYDVDFQLLRINLNQPFEPNQGGEFVKSNVLSSTCKIDRIGTKEEVEWLTVRDALTQMSGGQYRRQTTGCDLLHTDRQILLDAIRNYGNQGLYGSSF